MTPKPVLAFISTRFLFPADSGGKIRTTQILRGLKGGAFHVRLLMPSDAQLREKFAAEIDSVCDDLISWEFYIDRKPLIYIRKISWLFSQVPIPVRSDWSSEAHQVIRSELERGIAITVFDFPHSAILAAEKVPCPSVMFTHNIEAEIFKRHWQVAKFPVHRWIWKNQYEKMSQFERQTLRAFDTSIAVSERDCQFFRAEYGVRHCEFIPTGVDTEFFKYKRPENSLQVVFCGSMDWMANIDGIEFFHDRVWPLVKRQIPMARMKVVGRTPPGALVKKIRKESDDWHFTGFVDDVRDHVAGAAVFVIPLRVGGGTRIKAFEAMALGCPVVSTSIGVEGLPVIDGEHYLNADTDKDIADCVVSLMKDEGKRMRMSAVARNLVDEKFGFQKAAAVFEDICLRTAKLQKY